MKTLEDGVVCNFPSGAGALSHLPHIYTVTISDNYPPLQSRLSAGYTLLYSAVPMFTFNNFGCKTLTCPGSVHRGQAEVQSSEIFTTLEYEVITKFDPRGGPGPVLLIRSRQ